MYDGLQLGVMVVLQMLLLALSTLPVAEAQWDHQATPRGGAEESVEGIGLLGWLPLIALVILPLLCCALKLRRLPRRYAVGDNVLVRRNGNRVNRQHAAVITAIHKERRPLGSIGQADEMEFIYCMVDALTCNYFKPRAYDVQFEAGGQEKAPEAWVSPLPPGTEHILVAIEGGGAVRAEPIAVTVDGGSVPDTSRDAALAEMSA